MFNKELTNHLAILSETMNNIFRIGNTRNYGTEKTRNDDFYIAVNKNNQSSVSKVFAVGDASLGASLVVKAIASGRKVAEDINRILAP